MQSVRVYKRCFALCRCNTCGPGGTKSRGIRSLGPETLALIPNEDCRLFDEDLYYPTLGKRLAHAREFRELRQADLAGQLGDVEAGAISQWETDRRKPDPDKLRRICLALDISSDYLLGLIHRRPQRLPSGVEVAAEYGWRSYSEIALSGKERWQDTLEKAYEEERENAKERYGAKGWQQPGV